MNCYPEKGLVITIAIVWIVSSYYTTSTEATCNDEQVTVCRTAAKENALSDAESGGACEAKQYVAFTHTCTITDFRPHIDFCCCAFEQRALCCRYHHSGGLFRCTQSEDTIESLPWRPDEDYSHENDDFPTWTPSSSRDESKSLPLQILIPAILGPIVFLLCCISCCVKCCRIEDDNDDKTRWCWSRKKKKQPKKSTSESTAVSNQNGQVFQNDRPSNEENVPLYKLPESSDTCKVPLTDFIGESHRLGEESLRLVPTAPPLEGCVRGGTYSCMHDHGHGQSPLASSESGGSQMYTAPSYSVQDQNSHRNDFVRQDSGASSSHHHSPVLVGTPTQACPSCSSNVIPPPAYEESLQHRIIHQ